MKVFHSVCSLQVITPAKGREGAAATGKVAAVEIIKKVKAS